MAIDAAFDIPLQRRKKELPLIAKGVVEALPTDAHLAEQDIGGGALITMIAEYRDGAVQRGIAFKFFRPCHAAI
jgi:hypothetical protein